MDPAETITGTVHMVCVTPEHRGNRLSYPLCLAVLQRMRQRGLQRAQLQTHEHRLGAVKIYLDLGFQPVFKHPLHPQQWQDVTAALHWNGPLEPVLDAPGR